MPLLMTMYMDAYLYLPTTSSLYRRMTYWQCIGVYREAFLEHGFVADPQHLSEAVF